LFSRIIKKKPGLINEAIPVRLERPLHIIPRLAVKTDIQLRSAEYEKNCPIENLGDRSALDISHNALDSAVSIPYKNTEPVYDRTYIDNLIAEKTRELDAHYSCEKENAYNAGYERGKIDGFAEATLSLEPIERLFEGIKEEIKGAHEYFLKNAEEIMAKLSLEIAEAVVGEAVMKLSGELLEYNLKRCLDILGGSGDVTIKISPADYELAREKIDAIFRKNNDRFRFRFVPDPSITPGGCYIESPGGAIDGRIESQFKQIKENFLQII